VRSLILALARHQPTQAVAEDRLHDRARSRNTSTKVGLRDGGVPPEVAELMAELGLTQHREDVTVPIHVSVTAPVATIVLKEKEY
jgi:hypothetical protein